MYQSDLDRLIRLFAWSIFTTAIGVGLTSGTFDGGLMPFNKNLWTLSFSFFTGKKKFSFYYRNSIRRFLAGLAFAGFSIMYILIDKLKWWNSTPFQYPGTNSILIYIAHIVFATYFPVQWVVANTHAAHLAMGLWGCIFWIIIAYIFFKKRIFLVL
jgi:heparan-alpha-glucosaminide N-acetyltransferase